MNIKQKEEYEKKRKREQSQILGIMGTDRERCREVWMNEQLVSDIFSDGNAPSRLLAEIIRDYWSDSRARDNEALPRKFVLNWLDDGKDSGRLKNQEILNAEILFNATLFETAGIKYEDWIPIIDRLKEGADIARLLARWNAAKANVPKEHSDELRNIFDRREKNEISLVVAVDEAEALAVKYAVNEKTTDAPESDGANLVCLANVEEKQIEWLWTGRFPLGKLVLLYGDPGLGKSLMTLDAIATVTTGRAWADGSPSQVGSAIIVTAEDDLADTIVPRLRAAGADLSKVHSLETVRYTDDKGATKERCFTLADMPQLEDALERAGNVKLVVIDPVSAFLNGTDSHRDADIRQLLTPLTKLAAKHRVCLLLVTHMNKGGKGGTRALYRAMGSVGIAGAARAAFLVCRDPNNDDRRLMLPTKMNLAKESGGMAFSVADGPKIIWEANAVQMTADEALNGNEDMSKPKRREATELLRELLAHGDAVDSDKIMRTAKEQGISNDTVYRAASELNVIKKPQGMGGRWTWRLPKADDGDDSNDADLADVLKF